MNSILIIGATGRLGSAVMAQLLKKSSLNRVIALVRYDNKAAPLIRKGVDICSADYDDVPSLDAAISGIDKVLLISGTDAANRLAQHKNLIDAAKENGLKFMPHTVVSMKEIQTSKLTTGGLEQLPGRKPACIASVSNKVYLTPKDT